MLRGRALAALLLAAGLAWGCAEEARRPDADEARPVPAYAILKAARSQMGKPYAYGGHSPHTGFDCSGLVYWCYRQYDSVLPRTVRGQYRLGVAVARPELRAGDLVFFSTASGLQPSHVGIMLNHDRFIHAPAGGEMVREDELRNNYWRRTFYGARRIE
jgi:cell wall-associated NlpC family hydrolase